MTTRLFRNAILPLALALTGGCGAGDGAATADPTGVAVSAERGERDDHERGERNERVAPPDSRPYGFSYAEWSVRHWQWLFGLPATGHPAFAEGVVDVSVGQSGPVWFLVGAFNASGTVSRTITLPEGKSLFFPIVDTECSNLEAAPFYGATPAARRACATAASPFSGIAAELDGVAIAGLPDRYRVQSPPFRFTLPPAPADNLLGLAPGSEGLSASDGVFLMLNPLPVGWHDLHFTGRFDTFNFTLDITYHIHVVPRHD